MTQKRFLPYICLAIQLRMSAERSARELARVYLLAISVCAAAAVWPAISKSIWRRASRPRALSLPPRYRVHKAREKSAGRQKEPQSRPRAARWFPFAESDRTHTHTTGCKRETGLSPQQVPLSVLECRSLCKAIERATSFWLECHHGYRRKRLECGFFCLAKGCFASGRNRCCTRGCWRKSSPGAHSPAVSATRLHWLYTQDITHE